MTTLTKICFLTALALCGLALASPHSANAVHLSGSIEDASTGEKLSLVKIETQEGQFLGFADIDGNFKIDVPKGTSSLVFSHVGYKTLNKQLKFDPKHSQNLLVKMQMLAFRLDEVTINPQQNETALDLIKKVKSALAKNMVTRRYQCEGHERKWYKQNDRYIFFAEAIVDMCNEGYALRGHAESISLPKAYRISNLELPAYFRHYDYPSFKFPKPFRNFAHKYASKILPVILHEGFTFTCVDTLENQDESLAVIHYKRRPDAYKRIKNNPDNRYSFYPNMMHMGRILINLEDWSIKEITNKDKKSTNSQLKKSEFLNTSVFTKVGPVYMLSHSSYRYSFTEEGGEVFSGETITDFNKFDFTPLTDIVLMERYDCDLFYDRRFNTYSIWYKGKKAPFEKNSTYDPHFWKKMPVVPDWKKIVADLEVVHGIPLEEQFRTNSSFLIDEKELRALIKQHKGESKKSISSNYKYIKDHQGFK